jgi:hypothetical protein
MATDKGGAVPWQGGLARHLALWGWTQPVSLYCILLFLVWLFLVLSGAVMYANCPPEVCPGKFLWLLSRMFPPRMPTFGVVHLSFLTQLVVKALLIMLGMSCAASSVFLTFLSMLELIWPQFFMGALLQLLLTKNYNG